MILSSESRGLQQVARELPVARGLTKSNSPRILFIQSEFGEIHKEWTAAGVSASRTTTHRRMQDMDFSCRITCVKPL